MAPGSRREMFVRGRIAAHMPKLVSDSRFSTRSDGSARLRFAISYAVSNTKKRRHVRPDRAVIELTVDPATGAPVYRRIIEDEKLNRRITRHQYALKISKRQVRYLREMGLGSKSRSKRRKALEGVKIEIHHERDFKFVDGSYDWKQGLGFNAVTVPYARPATSRPSSSRLPTTPGTGSTSTRRHPVSRWPRGDPTKMSSVKSRAPRAAR